MRFQTLCLATCPISCGDLASLQTVCLFSCKWPVIRSRVVLVLMNFFSTLDIQAASQLSYLFQSTQTMKHVAISIYVNTLSCYCAFVSKYTFSSLTDLTSCICSLCRGHTGVVMLYMLVLGWQRWMKSWLKYCLLN